MQKTHKVVTHATVVMNLRPIVYKTQFFRINGYQVGSMGGGNGPRE
jgi:hypothetical protein